VAASAGRLPQRRLADNPFYVLGLRPECGRLDVEREGPKLLGMLELGLKSAASYMTPLGPQPRTADKVRVAMAELRSPDAAAARVLGRAAAAPEPPRRRRRRGRSTTSRRLPGRSRCTAGGVRDRMTLAILLGA
jgi:hypothetical protein